ncbi:tol-pal system protein YbgF [Hymenobacter sp. DG01]|uniref:tol-pal system protein YbgF n=1 Tax=Hymenobacter sp. DG01 TaxID=2584940 RepID=UPI0015DFEEE9|nr:tol-pal system protein YbgF [Hymenobacter sp. DG01]
MALGTLLFSVAGSQAQQVDSAGISRRIELQNVDVAPSAVDTKGWLLMDNDIKTELEGGVSNLYNFKFDKAERQFRSLRRRYVHHPLPYFLMGLSAWWKIVPTNVSTKQFDKAFFAYMDTATTKAEALYKQDNQNYEACFFLSASYGFSSRLHAERHDWAKATIEAKRALDYLEKSREANGLSPEFLFGQALFNYYAVWIGEEKPWLKPVLLFFPKGNKALGLQQLRSVTQNAVYTAPEAKFFLMKILTSERENKEAEAFPLVRSLALDYPDNAYFQRFYAMQCFNRGDFRECERVSLEILDKYNQGLQGFDGFSGRYASYFLAFIRKNKYQDVAKAKSYYQRCIVFSESTDQTKGGYYQYANLSLARMATAEKDEKAARRYYEAVLASADRKSDMYREAKQFIKTTRRPTSSRVTDQDPLRTLVHRDN